MLNPRTIAVVAAATLLVGLAACSDSRDEGSDTNGSDTNGSDTNGSDTNGSDTNGNDTNPPAPTGTGSLTDDPTDVPDPTAEPDDESGAVDEREAETSTPERDPVLSLDGNQGARADLNGFRCSESGGLWSASGSIENHTDRDWVYVVSVAVVEREGRSSVVRRNVVLEVGAGQSAEFTEPELVAIDQDDLECFVSVNRGDRVVD